MRPRTPSAPRPAPAAVTARAALASAFSFTALVLAACAGPDSRAGESGQRLRVLVQDYGSGQHFELASEAHTDRVAYYSEVRSGAARKIQTDEVMALFVDELEDQGFGRYAQEGRAPTRGGGAVTRAIEIEADGTTEHWLIGNGSPIEERRAFNECLGQFLELYNISASFQSVENPHGHEFFDREPSGAAAAADER